MFLGTSRRWWLAAALPLLLGLVLLVTSDGTVLRTAAAILLLLLAMVLFGMAPMRYGQSARTPAATSDETPAANTSVAIDAPGPRPSIVARDPADV